MHQINLQYNKISERKYTCFYCRALKQDRLSFLQDMVDTKLAVVVISYFWIRELFVCSGICFARKYDHNQVDRSCGK